MTTPDYRPSTLHPVRFLESPWRVNTVALIALAASACGGGGAAPLEPTIEAEALSTLELTAPSSVLRVGQTFQLVATPTDATGAPLAGLPAPTFTSSVPSVAEVSPDGLLTSVAEGTTVVSASLVVGAVSKTASAIVTVAAATTGNVVGTPGTSFDPPTLTVSVGDTVVWSFSGAVHNVTFGPRAPPAGDIPDQQAGASVSRVFDAPGTYSYECTRHTGMTGSVVVQSGEQQVFSAVEIRPATPSIMVGDSVQLVAVPLDQNGTALGGLPAASFSASDPARVNVSATGLVVGTAAGTVTVTGSITHQGVTRSATASVTVMTPQAGTAVVGTANRLFTPASVTIPAGGTVTWQFVESVHNVTFRGGAPPGGDIGDQNPGNAVSRSFPSAGTYSYDCTRHSGMIGTVVVTGGGTPTYTSLSLTPSAVTIGLGGSVQLVAQPLDQNGVPIPGLPAPTFTTSDGLVVGVEASGVATGVSAGSATITATLSAGGTVHSATATVQVVTGPVTTVAATDVGFAPDRVDIAPGGTIAWSFSGTQTHNVTFDDVLPPGGNVPDTSPGSSVARTFPAAGVYDYTCTIHDYRGRVRVE